MDPSPLDRGQAWVLSVLERFEEPLLRYVRRIAPDPETARDVVQYAFLRLCQEVRAHDGGSNGAASDEEGAAPHIRSVGQWLYAVCRNRVVDVLRREKRMQPLEALTGERDGSGSPGALRYASREPPPDAAAETHDSCALVRGVLQTLPTAQQEVVHLWAEGFSCREIGQITRRTEVNVRVIIHRAFQALRQHPRIQRLLVAYSAAADT